jgi:surface antigen
MRAGRALVCGFAMLVASAAGTAADAAGERQGRNASAQNAESAQRSTARPQARSQVAQRQTAQRQTAQRQAAQRPASRQPASRGAPRLDTTLDGAAFASAAPVATPAVYRGAPMSGTPILHVAQTAGLSCVPFARMATGMQISGDARMWWHNAAGVYARGSAPERGAILSFPASGGMRRGHVAVVSRVVNDRTILIDHSNWAGPGITRGTVMRGVTVVDVSDRNDWTAVRVQVGWDNGAFGRTYSTHGFIYNRPHGTRVMTASAGGLIEVAEASPHVAQHQRLASTLGR